MIIDRIKHPKYIDLVIAIGMSYVLIKIIDNYEFFISIFSSILTVLGPFICAFIIAYVLNPLMNLCERRFKLNRGMSILVTYILIIGVISIAGTYFIPKMVNSLIDIAKSSPAFAEQAQKWLSNMLSDENFKVLMDSSLGQEFSPSMIIEKASTVVLSLIDGSLSVIFSFTNSFIKWLFGFILSIYILIDKEKFTNMAKRGIYLVFRKKHGNTVINFVRNIHTMIGVYIGTKALDSLIIGILAWLGLTLLGSEYTLLIATIVGITNMIPYFGPFVGMLIAFIINVFFAPIKSIIILVFLFLLQQFDAWYLDPKLIGNKVGASPFLIILAVTIGGAVYGPVGMILAVPTVAVIKTYIKAFFEKIYIVEDEEKEETKELEIKDK